MSRRVFKAVLVSALCCVFAGCIVPEPRTGNLFLSTRQNIGFLTRSESGPNMAVALDIIFVPAFFIGTFTTAPIWDVLCLPVDCYLKLTGTEFLFLDDAGQPVRWCGVSFYNHALQDEHTGHWWSSYWGYYSPGVHVERTGGWSLTATKDGYYPMTINSIRDSQVVTARIDRVLNPIALNVRELRFPPPGSTPWWVTRKKGPVAFNENGFTFSYDFLKSDWLPPWGNGSVADVSFRYSKTVLGREQVQYANGIGTNVYCMCELAMEFPGEGNGMIEVKPSDNAGIKIRNAPDDGYSIKSHICRKGRTSRYKYESNYNGNACYAFRIRADNGEGSKISKAYYGKIYGDIVLNGTENEITDIRFLYYFNPTLNDRNLEWDMKNNLCPCPGDTGEPKP